MLIDFVCKPHPGGLQPPPELAPARDVRTVAARFQEAVADVDVLLYDFPATYDERNRPIVDPGYFRRLFLGGAPR